MMFIMCLLSFFPRDADCVVFTSWSWAEQLHVPEAGDGQREELLFCSYSHVLR